jgi:hypothetical protein
VKVADDLHLPSVLVAVIAVLMSLAVFVAITSRNGTPIGIYDNGIGDRWPAGHHRLAIVDRTRDDGWHQAVADAVDTWAGGGSSLQLTVKTGGGRCHQSRDHIEVCMATADAIASEGAQGEQGLFLPKVGRSHDYHSAIVLVCSDCGIDQTRMTVIATHEVGHALGLAHSPDPQSVMYYLGGSALPDAHDLQILRLLEGTAALNGG